MFSSAGYFKGLLCPFFLSGLCERPYCHFKHSKPEEGKPLLQRSTSNSSYIESLSDKPWSAKSSTDSNTDLYNEKLNHNNSAQVNDKNGENANSTEKKPKEIIGYNKYTGEPIFEKFKQETYEVESPTNVAPTFSSGDKVPVAFNKYTGKPIYEAENQTQQIASKNSVPEYNPTPIEELKKQKNAQQKLDNEYDPEQNYSTKTITASHSLPYAPKRTISYEPTIIRPKKIARKASSYEFDISKFSDSDESENGNLNEEDEEEYSPVPVVKEKPKDDKTVSVEKETNDTKNNVSVDNIKGGKLEKDLNYFAKLLLSDPKKSTLEKIRKTKLPVNENDANSLDSDSSKKDTSSVNGDDKKVGNTNEKSENKSTKRKSVESKTDEKDVSQTKKNKTSIDLDDKNNKISTDKTKKGSKHSSNKHNSSSKSGHSKSDSSHSRKDSGSDSHKKTSSSSHKKSDSSHGSDSHKKDDELSSSSKAKKDSEKNKSEDKNSKSELNDKKSGTDKHSKDKKSELDKHSKHKKSESTKHSKDKNSESDKHSKHKKSESDKHAKDKKSESDKHLKDKKLESSNSEKHNKSSSDRKHSSDQKHKSSHDSKHSSKNHSGSSKERNNSGKSSGEKHKTDERKKHHSSKSSTSEDKKSEKSSKVRTEKRSSTDSDSKRHIVDINVDLFGEDSDVEMLEDSDIETHPLLDDSDLDDGDLHDECLRIFKETHQTKAKHVKKSSPEKKKKEEPIIVGKKRVAHDSAKEVVKKIPEKPYSKLSPAQVMHNRFLEMRKKALEEAAKLHSNTPSSSSSSSLNNSSSSKTSSRIAHKPASSTKTKPEKTVITTASKTEKRQARLPNVSNLERPQIPSEFGSKVPTNIRQRYLNSIIDECLKLYDNAEEAFKRGQEEEMAVYKRSNTKTIYLNVAINAIKRLRNEIAENSPSSSKQTKTISAMKLSHEAILGGKNAAKTSYTVKRSGNAPKVIENFKGDELFKRLSKYILTQDQLKENGFPMLDPFGTTVIYNEKNYKKNDRLHEKICIRCGNKFIVYPNGKYAKQEECVYHWAKAWKKKVNGMFDSRYNCCGGDSSSEGCQVGKNHVHETNKWENLTGYMKTLPCSPPVDGDYGVFAMDCEMVYTTAGVELARVTVSDQDNNAVYETLVKPDNDVVDLNTRFSGITEDDLDGVTTSLRDVQAVLLSLFTDKTILIGHSLESDLMAVKIIHKTVVDTSVVFPHRLGPPYKRALRTLMAEYLQKIIQDDVGGHDSMEDAVSCMELMHMKIKEDARKENR